MKAAGILFTSLNGKALFLKRTATAPDCPSCWDLPGGGCEGDETAEQCAVRECREEIGFLPEGTRVLHTRTKMGSALKGVAGLGAPASIPVAAGAPAAPDMANPLGVSAAPGPAAVMPPDVDFTTFLQKVTNEFTPELNDEHDGWAWAPLNAPPEPLHPGCRIALDRIAMNELDVARAIADGRLTSPQRYENVWLFAIRITGTRAAYRTKYDEYVFRKPENYLTAEFLARCNGLAVVWKHPKGSILNSEEFSNRVVGSVFLPYIAGDEVWAVAKIYVEAAAQMMEDENLSTSPGVNFADLSVNVKMTLELEDNVEVEVLNEGDPSLFDHVAICALGVWDKGGEPSGIRSESREDSAMTPEEEKAKKDADEKMVADKAKKDADEKAAADKAKKDAEEKEKADKAKKDAEAGTKLATDPVPDLQTTLAALADSIGSIGKRMDAYDAADKAKKDAEEEELRKKGDPKQMAADKAKKDAEEEEEKKKADKAKKDAEEKAKADAAAMKDELKELRAMIPKQHGDPDYHSVVDAQARADEVFCKFGQRAPIPQQGETAGIYERRCVKKLREHSATWAKASVESAFADDASFAIVRDQVYKEATTAALNPANIEAGTLRAVKEVRDGHTHITYHGDPANWMNRFAGPVQWKSQGNWKTN
jgi:8-oxo-dGTP pyrophosphatase MutT (NUDIX family)